VACRRFENEDTGSGFKSRSKLPHSKRGKLRFDKAGELARIVIEAGENRAEVFHSDVL